MWTVYHYGTTTLSTGTELIRPYMEYDVTGDCCIGSVRATRNVTNGSANGYNTVTRYIHVPLRSLYLLLLYFLKELALLLLVILLF
jgi:hypothetical protein